MNFIYLVGVGRTSSSLTHRKFRTWAWVHQPSEGIMLMRKDPLFFEDGYYDIGIVEKYEKGSSVCLGEWFFSSEGVPIDKPEAWKNIVNFLM